MINGEIIALMRISHPWVNHWRRTVGRVDLRRTPVEPSSPATRSSNSTRSRTSSRSLVGTSAASISTGAGNAAVSLLMITLSPSRASSTCESIHASAIRFNCSGGRELDRSLLTVRLISFGNNLQIICKYATGFSSKTLSIACLLYTSPSPRD